jgi:protein-L-isoaspartate(D-aspartate) O-methyltransferase
MSAGLRLKPEAIGMGMTSQRVRDRLIERLRAGSHPGGGIRDERVLNAIRTVPRHLFVDEALAARAYEDNALPIGHGQTISQPWVVAKMTEAVLEGIDPSLLHAPALQPHSAFAMQPEPSSAPKVLEVGTGSGYQAVVLAALGLQVYTVERIGDLLRTARKRFRSLGLNIRSKHDDGRIGWPENGPYDAIVVTAGAPALVEALKAQLAPGGTLVAPVGGSGAQSLLQLRKDAEGNITETVLAQVVFVPLLSGMVD